jgi:hypothetical protein
MMQKGPRVNRGIARVLVSTRTVTRQGWRKLTMPHRGFSGGCICIETEEWAKR